MDLSKLNLLRNQPKNEKVVRVQSIIYNKKFDCVEKWRQEVSKFVENENYAIVCDS